MDKAKSRLNTMGKLKVIYRQEHFGKTSCHKPETDVIN